MARPAPTGAPAGFAGGPAAPAGLAGAATATATAATTAAAPFVPAGPPPWARAATATVSEPVFTDPATVTKSDEGRVAKSLAAILLLGFLLQVGLSLYGSLGEHDASHLIRMSQWAILAFYGVVLACAVRMASTVNFLPLWSVGPTAENVAVGALKGVVTAAGVLMLLSGATGRIQVAPSVKFQLGDATLMSVGLALLLLTVAAPVVEELLFRGMTAEALRYRGQAVALVVSGVLFALWHMRFGLFEIAYYTVLGVLLGRIYFKRGLAASIAAHAGFNGTLAVIALVFIIGPGSTLSANGVTVEAPGGWDSIDTAATGQADARFAAHGPSSAVFYVMPAPIPVEVPLDKAMAFFQSNLPGIADPSTMRLATYPAGQAVRFEVVVKGHKGEMAVLATGTGWWIIGLEQATERTRDDFEEMVESIRLPA